MGEGEGEGAQRRGKNIVRRITAAERSEQTRLNQEPYFLSAVQNSPLSRAPLRKYPEAL